VSRTYFEGGIVPSDIRHTLMTPCCLQFIELGLMCRTSNAHWHDERMSRLIGHSPHHFIASDHHFMIAMIGDQFVFGLKKDQRTITRIETPL
jgi:hypothetical protein